MRRYPDVTSQICSVSTVWICDMHQFKLPQLTKVKFIQCRRIIGRIEGTPNLLRRKVIESVIVSTQKLKNSGKLMITYLMANPIQLVFRDREEG